MFYTDFVHNQQGHGEVGEWLARSHFDPGFNRPYINNKGVKCVALLNGKFKTLPNGQRVHQRREVAIRRLMDHGMFNPVWNATSMRRESWVFVDDIVIKAARDRLVAFDKLRSWGTVGGFDAMSHMTYEYENMDDPGEAVVDFDGLTAGRTDSPLFGLNSVPLPITHDDFFYSQRRLSVSANRGQSLDVLRAETAGRRVGEMIEDTTTGVVTGETYGSRASGYLAHQITSKVWGFTNFTNRLTKTDLTTPTGSNPEAILQDVLEMVEIMRTNKFYGPYEVLYSTNYSTYFDQDYFRSGGTSVTRSVMERLQEIKEIVGWTRVDRLTSGYQMIMVDTKDDARPQAIDGVPPTTIMWETHGGQKINWKVFAIQVPLLRRKYNGTSPVLHATTS